MLRGEKLGGKLWEEVEVGEDGAVQEVEVDHREKQGEEEMRCGELEAFLRVICMSSQQEGKEEEEATEVEEAEEGRQEE